MDRTRVIKVKDRGTGKFSQEIIGGLIDKCDAGTAIAFTNGSCLGNPGSCGAGVCLFPLGSSEPMMLKQPVSNRGSILLGELVGIKMAPQYISRSLTRGEGIRKVHIFRQSECCRSIIIRLGT